LNLMSKRTLEEILLAMEGEVKWHKREAERRALVASQTAITTSRIAAMVEQEKCLAVSEKLSQWRDTIAKWLVDSKDVTAA
jgi:hypothetical protein